MHEMTRLAEAVALQAPHVQHERHGCLMGPIVLPRCFSGKGSM